MAEGKKPAVIIIAGVIELAFSIFVFIYSIASLVMGCTGSVMGMAGTVGTDGTVSEANAPGALQSAGIMLLITVILSMVAFVMGIIGIIGASNLFSGKKAGVGLSNFWAIALFLIFAIGLIPSIIQLLSAGATAGALNEVSKNLSDTGTTVTQADLQTFTTGLPVVMMALSGVFYLLPAIIVFILLKLKPVKEFFVPKA